MRWLIALLLFAGLAAIHADPLRVTTWNLGFTPQESVWAADGERVAQVASALRSLDADVVLLQAVPDRQTCETLAALLAPFHYLVAACSAFTNGSGGRLPQVAILSKFPVAASWTKAWESERMVAPSGGLAVAAIRLGVGLVVVYSVQLKDNVTLEDPERETQINILERELAAAQLAQYAGSIDARLTNPAPAIIVAGSLNTDPDQSQFVSENTLRILEEAGLKNAFNGVPSPQRITHPGHEEAPDATFDYVFARGANFLRHPAILMSGVSSHLPVTCELDVRLAVPIAKTPPAGQPTIHWQWWWTLSAALLLFVWWWFGSRKRFYSPAQLGDSGVEGLLAYADEANHTQAGTRFADEAEPVLSASSIQSPAADPTGSEIRSLERRAVAAERRAARAAEVVRQGLVPHLAGLMKDALFRRVASQRAQLLQMQQAGALQVAELERRMARIQMQLQSRLTAYERRIAELEKEVSAKEQTNRELLNAKMQMMKQLLESAQGKEEETRKVTDGVME